MSAFYGIQAHNDAHASDVLEADCRTGWEDERA
jgi:hypothetical protein